MIKLIDPDHPFYQPLWRRLLIIAFCVGWTIFEFWGGSPTWGMISLAISAYTVCTLIIFFKPTGISAETPVEEPTRGDDPV